MSRRIYHSPAIEQLRSLIKSSVDAQGLPLADDLDEQLAEADKFINAPVSIIDLHSDPQHKSEPLSPNRISVDFNDDEFDD